ncbi:hypothetical protein J5X84_44640 [Streptosporangiaceae bacterium NEAU-GS5]|nr:hypothetical protein [Streptosporangiaceae bacterium NEAU-GS5]
MSKTVIVRYQTRPDAAEQNVRLLEEVFTALAKIAPNDFQYTAYRLADDVTFVHVACHAETGNPLTTLPEFAAFQRELAQRCVQQPEPRPATVVGSYGRTS